MTTAKENAQFQLGAKDHHESAFFSHYKRILPAFGKQFDAMRKRGLVPEMKVVLTYDWQIGQLYPRIVLDRHIDPTRYRLEFLSGLNLQICIYNDDLFLVDSLIKELKKIHPASIATFNFDLVGTGTPAFSVVYQAELEVAA